MLTHRPGKRNTPPLWHRFVYCLFIFSLCASPDLLWAQEQRPNILIYIADDISYPHLSAYGCSWVSSPGFDRVAKEGVLFHAAYTPNAKCAPSRACLLTGRNSWQLEAAVNHFPYFPAKFQTFMEALRAHGYATGHTGKGWAPGEPGTIDGVPRQLTGPAFQNLKLKPSTSGISSIDYAANFEAFLQQKPDNQAFCFWYGSNEPHRSYEFESGVKKGGKALSDIPEVPGYWPDIDTVRHDMLDYAMEIEHADSHFDKMLKTLESQGLLENTLIIALADHGMPFPRVKGQAYESSNHIPLAIMWPGQLREAGRDCNYLVSIIDLAPTILEAAGVSPASTRMEAILGQSLVPLLTDPASEPLREFVLVGKERHDIGRPNDWGYPIRGIQQDSLLYLYNFEPTRWPAGNPEAGYLNCDGSPLKSWLIVHYHDDAGSSYWQSNLGKRPTEELYDLRQDPDCLDNLADAPAYGLLKEHLRLTMMNALREEGDWRMLGRGAEYEAFPYSGVRQNFYHRLMNHENPPFPAWVSERDVHVVEE
ncbi:MAG: sulfatase [Bacteroidia bacterium]|nr:sulfatase [Bacteroidia bacterium]